MKKLLLVLILASSMFYNVGCDSGDLVAGAIGVGIGVGLDRWWHHHHHRHHRWGRYSASEDKQIANEFAQKYNISEDSAQKIKKAFDGVPSQGLSSFASIGLTSHDLRAIVKNQIPEARGLQSLAAKLDMSEAQARDLLLAMHHEFALQAANVRSDYWQACMETGSWKTPQNTTCRSASERGCAPETGATVCY